MTKFLKLLGVFGMVAGLAACSLFEGNGGTRDPITIGRTLGFLSCTVAASEKPEVKAPLAQALALVKGALESDNPSLSAISAALAKIEDSKIRTYAGGVVAVVLAIFPNLPENADTALPEQVQDALLAAIAACNPVLGVTTSTSTTSTTSTTVEESTTSTTEPEPSTTSTTEPEPTTTSTSTVPEPSTTSTTVQE